ncbi:hypothetical protein DRN77_02905 [Methanosarcinales archaeon]|nr:MAG: hypothetical protein DRN77_02905 [Methanosarcinales archaeon]
MYAFTEGISELGNLFKKFNRYYVLLDSVLIFMAAYTGIIFSGIDRICAGRIGIDVITFSDIGKEIAASALCGIVLAVMTTIAVLAILVVRARGRYMDVCAEIGTAYSELDEPLKTAYDNCEIENVVMKDLAEDVTKEMDNIAYSSFLDRKRIFSRIVAIILMALFIVLLAVTNLSVVESVDAANFPGLNKLAGGGGGNGGGSGGDMGQVNMAGTGSVRDIYGEPSVVSIEGTKLDLTMYTGVGSEFSIRETSETETHDFKESSPFPVEPVASEAPEPIPGENSDLVGRYFEELAAAG